MHFTLGCLPILLLSSFDPWPLETTCSGRPVLDRHQCVSVNMADCVTLNVVTDTEAHNNVFYPLTSETSQNYRHFLYTPYKWIVGAVELSVIVVCCTAFLTVGQTWFSGSNPSLYYSRFLLTTIKLAYFIWAQCLTM